MSVANIEKNIFKAVIAATWSAIEARVNSRDYEKAVSYLRAQIVDSKIYEEQAELYREKEVFSANPNTAGFSEHLKREVSHTEKKNAYEKMALDLGERLAALSPSHAIAALQLIQYVGYYMRDIQEEVLVPNVAYSKAQTMIAGFYSSLLKEESTLGEQAYHQVASEILRAAFNSRKGLESNNFSAYYAALRQYLGSEVVIPSDKELSATENDTDSGAIALSKIYLSILQPIRKSMDPSGKDASEKKMLEKIQFFVTLIFESNTIDRRNRYTRDLLNSFESYMDPKAMSKRKLLTGFNIAAAKTSADLLCLELPIYLGHVLWELKQKKSVAINLSAANSASAASASAAQPSGSAIVSAYAASMATAPAIANTATAKPNTASASSTSQPNKGTLRSTSASKNPPKHQPSLP